MMQAVRGVTRSMTSGRRMFATMQASHVTYNDMKKSKHDFVHFVNTAMKDKSSGEAKELYHYLNKCFTDNDTDYDGLVSYRGFNAMVAEAAVAPRRFGFAPHTREMYKSAEEYDLARTQLFNKLKTGSKGRISMESWINWSMAHIKEKVGKGLEEHTDAKYERSKIDCIQFFKDVTKKGSHLCKKSSSSTQFKEFYVMQNDMFMECDKEMHGYLNRAQFEDMVQHANAIPMKFGMNWYKGADFDKVAVNNHVGLQEWLKYSLKVVEDHTAKL